MTTLQNLDMNYLRGIAERMKAERDEARNKPAEPIITSQTTTPAIQDKKDYVYVPALGLYISKNRYLRNKNWDQAQEIIHREGKRMPTIPEFIQFLKYLRSDEGKSAIGDAEALLDDIYKREGVWRAEWLDAKFETADNRLHIFYYDFDGNGKIIQKQERLEIYLLGDKKRINLASWINNPTKQGLPQLDCSSGYLEYNCPRDGQVARFGAGLGNVILVCNRSSCGINPSLGVRIVERPTGATQ